MHIPLNRYAKLLTTYLKAQRGSFLLLILLLFSSTGLQVFIPQITRSFIDSASNGQAVSTLQVVAAAFLVLAIFAQGISVSATYLGEKIAWTATNALRVDLMAHCLQLDMAFHNNHTPGEMIERIDSDITQLASFFSELFIQIAGNVLLTAGILVVLFREDWRLGVAFTAFSLSIFYVLNRVRSLAVPAVKAYRQANADLSGFLEERLSGTEDIRSSGAQVYTLSQLKGLHQTIRIRWLKSSQIQVIVGIVIGLALTSGYAVAFISGYGLYTAGLITIGTAYLVMNYMLLLNRPFFELAQQIDNLQGLTASLERIEELLHLNPSQADGNIRDFGSGALAVTFEDASFGYTPDQLVLKNVSLSIERGEILGVLGRTGSGKTTLSRLIFRLYDISGGAIRLNGIDVRDLNLSALRRRVGMVTQDVQLFAATIRDNLTLFNHAIPDSRILEVIGLLGLDSWLATQSEGLETLIDASGKNVSAGEAQMLAFARVFLGNPDLVILDEASSRLDPATEAKLERANALLLQDRTAIIIAHRLNTLNHADKIVIIEAGKIVEQGRRADLAADETSRFYHLLQTSHEGVIE